MENRKEAHELVNQSRKIDSNVNKKQYVDILNAAIKKDPYYLEPYMMLGFFYFRERDWEKALMYLQKCVEIDYLLEDDEETAKKVYITLGKVYQITGNIEKSLQSFKSLIGLFPNSKASEKILKEIYSKLENRDEWFTLYKDGYNYCLDGKYEDALVSFKKSFGITNNFSWAYYYNARALMKMGRYQRGISSLGRALELDEHFLFYYGLFEIYELMKEYDKAKSFMEKVLSMNPLFSLILLDQCEEYLENDEEEKAEGIIKNVLLFPELPDDLRKHAKELAGKLKTRKVETADILKEDRLIIPEHTVEKEVEPVLHKMKKQVEKIYYDQVLDVEAEIEKMTRKAREDAKEIVQTAHKEAAAIISEARQKVDEDKVYETQKQEIRPDEIRAKMLNRAREEAETIIRGAREEANNIVQGAKEEAEEISQGAREEAESILANAHKKADKLLSEEKTAEEQCQRLLEQSTGQLEKILTQALSKILEGKGATEEQLLKTKPIQKEVTDASGNEIRNIIRDEMQVLKEELKEEFEKLGKIITQAVLKLEKTFEAGKEKEPEKEPVIQEKITRRKVEGPEPDEQGARKGRRLRTRLLRNE